MAQFVEFFQFFFALLLFIIVIIIIIIIIIIIFIVGVILEQQLLLLLLLFLLLEIHHQQFCDLHRCKLHEDPGDAPCRIQFDLGDTEAIVARAYFPPLLAGLHGQSRHKLDHGPR